MIYFEAISDVAKQLKILNFQRATSATFCFVYLEVSADFSAAASSSTFLGAAFVKNDLEEEELVLWITRDI